MLFSWHEFFLDRRRGFRLLESHAWILLLSGGIGYPGIPPEGERHLGGEKGKAEAGGCWPPGGWAGEDAGGPRGAKGLFPTGIDLPEEGAMTIQPPSARIHLPLDALNAFCRKW